MLAAGGPAAPAHEDPAVLAARCPAAFECEGPTVADLTHVNVLLARVSTSPRCRLAKRWLLSLSSFTAAN
jgi:hypothetical protein